MLGCLEDSTLALWQKNPSLRGSELSAGGRDCCVYPQERASLPRGR